MDNFINMRKLAYFSVNFNHDFIEKCWCDAPEIAAHLRTKFNSKSCISSGEFLSFFLGLGSNNQIKLCKYITEKFKI